MLHLSVQLIAVIEKALNTANVSILHWWMLSNDAIELKNIFDLTISKKQISSKMNHLKESIDAELQY